MLRDEVQLPVLVGGGVGDLVGGVELGQLRALPGRARTPPASSERSTSKRYQHSSHITTIATTLGSVGERAHATTGAPERAGDAADGARVLGRVEDVERALPS